MPGHTAAWSEAPGGAPAPGAGLPAADARCTSDGTTTGAGWSWPPQPAPQAATAARRPRTSADVRACGMPASSATAPVSLKGDAARPR